MNENKELILLETFKLLMTRSFDSITVCDIEHATGLSRGALFYHFRNKEDIFRQVLDYYTVIMHRLDFGARYVETDTLYDCIHNFVKAARKLVKNGKSLLGIENVERAYFRFLLQAVKQYPDFCKKFTQSYDEQTRFWEKMVRKAQAGGEVRAGIDPLETAKHFRYIYVGMSLEKTLDSGIDSRELLHAMMAYYDVIKA
ncbi:MAG: TetR/AcrR family transcriptional regulator [Rikenellaceae bacterium]|nr:TetR/AcrR family transcriptional regulator [Rikenellaceae bacterium]